MSWIFETCLSITALKFGFSSKYSNFSLSLQMSNRSYKLLLVTATLATWPGNTAARIANRNIFRRNIHPFEVVADHFSQQLRSELGHDRNLDVRQRQPGGISSTGTDDNNVHHPEPFVVDRRMKEQEDSRRNGGNTEKIANTNEKNGKNGNGDNNKFVEQKYDERDGGNTEKNGKDDTGGGRKDNGDNHKFVEQKDDKRNGGNSERRANKNEKNGKDDTGGGRKDNGDNNKFVEQKDDKRNDGNSEKRATKNEKDDRDDNRDRRKDNGDKNKFVEQKN